MACPFVGRATTRASRRGGVVRTVLVVSEGEFPWADLKRLLAKANARIVECTLARFAETAGRTKPDLVVLDEQTHRTAGSSLQHPHVVVRTGAASGVTIPAHARPPVAWVSWPVDDDVFLEITARMLRVSERRTFRALIRVFVPRSGQWFMGRSEDFSLTGLAFHCDRSFAPGEPLVVSLHLPGRAGGVEFSVEVTREVVNPADGKTYLGARFVRLEPAVRRKLDDFILKQQ